MSTRTNREILTGGEKYRHKRDKKFGVEEVVFDPESRVDFLTGFHKRKVERREKAKKFHQEQDRLARIEARKKAREDRQQEFEDKLRELEEAKNLDISQYLKEENEDGEDWNGFEESNEENEDEPVKSILHKKETFKIDNPQAMGDAVVDEETTVTIDSIDNPLLVKVGQSSLDILAQANNVNLAKSEEVLENSIDRAKKYAVICGVSKPAKPAKEKKKKFRYLTKGERRENNRKVKMSKLKSRNRDQTS